MCIRNKLQWLEDIEAMIFISRQGYILDLDKAILVYFSPRSVFSGWITDFPPFVLFVVVLMFFFLSAKGAAQWFSRSAKVHWLSHDDWCLREGHDSWIQDRPDPRCHFKQSDRGEKPCLMASLPQKSDASHLGRPQKSLKGEQSRV